MKVVTQAGMCKPCAKVLYRFFIAYGKYHMGVKASVPSFDENQIFAVGD